MNKHPIAEKVRQLRKQFAWTQDLLAKNANVSLRTIQRLERNGQCSQETLLAVAGAFDVDVKELTGLRFSGQERANTKLELSEEKSTDSRRMAGRLRGRNTPTIEVSLYKVAVLVLFAMMISGFLTVGGLQLANGRTDIVDKDELAERAKISDMDILADKLHRVIARYDKNMREITDHIDNYNLVASGHIFSKDEMADYQVHMMHLPKLLEDMIDEEAFLHQFLAINSDILVGEPNPLLRGYKVGAPSFVSNVKLNVKRRYSYYQMLLFHDKAVKEQLIETIEQEGHILGLLTAEDLTLPMVTAARASYLKEQLSSLLNYKKANIELLRSMCNIADQRIEVLKRRRYNEIQPSRYSSLVHRSSL